MSVGTVELRVIFKLELGNKNNIDFCIIFILNLSDGYKYHAKRYKFPNFSLNLWM